MDIFQSVFLALIQGLTEFLPISSSAHLILPSRIFGWQDQGMAFDVAVHVGTLSAVVIYFRRDVGALIQGWWRSLRGQRTEQGRLAWLLILATIPAAVMGLVGKGIIEGSARSTLVISISTLLFGLLLWYADRKSALAREMKDIGVRDALKIGLAQAIALIPGTSRSGITMTMALLLGFDRRTAATFSFLLSIPIITLAGLYLGWQLMTTPADIDMGELLIGIVVSFVAAYACIHYFLKIIERMGMLPFVLYRLALGVLLLVFSLQ
ncbi:undecaprenyl-diphosphate phosphatase [Aeromonas bivalvium]|uniref:undecaprenyl-diphosphate phosphatase n=1 Tax=Aeromonas bivalvium TaxID=440079 RepID=UPI0038D1B19A